MSQVLVTGGTGVLGRQLVPRLLDAGHSVRVLSRRAPPPAGPPGASGASTVRGDLATGEGLADAVAGAEVVVHCATGAARPRQARLTDVEGTNRLLEAARASGCEHLVYISIVGIDRVPFPYYRIKLEAEGAVEASRVPFTIFRATQFHDLILRLLESSRRLPAVVVPRRFVFQVVETAEVAARMVQLVAAGPSGRAPDLGGPAVRRIEDLAGAYRSVRGLRRPVLAVPLPGRAARAFRAGLHTCPDHADGAVTWEDFLRGRFPSGPSTPAGPSAPAGPAG